MEIQPIATRIFEPDEELAAFVKEHVSELPDGSVIVITSKIAALSLGYYRSTKDTTKEQYIEEESDDFVKNKWCYVALKEGHWCPDAGVDAYNAKDMLIGLPHDSFEAAAHVRKLLMRQFRVKKLGVLISDSRSTPLRNGNRGVAVSYAGFKGLKRYDGQADIHGRKGFTSRVNVADSLAGAAVFLMGEGDEQQPLALITDAPVEFSEEVDQHELKMDPKNDLFRAVYKKIEKEDA